MTYSDAKYQFQIEIPVDLIRERGVPAGFYFMTQRQGVKRYYSDELETTISRLNREIAKMRSIISVFSRLIFKRFTEKRSQI